jgi:hypothetical protein
MRSAMPPSSPGSLARETYFEALAYILKANGYPAGATELGAGPIPLDRITLEPKPR